MSDFLVNVLYRIPSKTIRGFLLFFSQKLRILIEFYLILLNKIWQKLRITFECGLHSSAGCFRRNTVIGKGTLRPINNVKAIEKEDYLLNQLSQ